MEDMATVLSTRYVYEGRVVTVRVDDIELADGHKTRREVVEHRGAVAMVPVLPDGRVMLVRQWRYAAGEALLEIPAGTLEEGETPVDCASRELAEETGHAPGSIEHLTSFYSSPGFTNEKLHVFLATDLKPADADPDADEDIETVVLDWQEAVAMCLDGRITDGKTITGILAADRSIHNKS